MIARLTVWRRLTLTSYFLLILHITFWFFVADPPANKSSAFLSVLYVLILLWPWQQLVTNNPRVYMWSSYLVLLYFTHAVVETYANNEARVYAFIELALTIIYFVSSTFCYRYSRQLSKQKNPADIV